MGSVVLRGAKIGAALALITCGVAQAAPSGHFNPLQISADPTEGKAMHFAISGSASGEPASSQSPWGVDFNLRKLPGPPCASDYLRDSSAGGVWLFKQWFPVPSTFSLSDSHRSDVGMKLTQSYEFPAGNYLECTWLEDYHVFNDHVATASRHFTIRIPHYKFTLKGPRTLKLHNYFTANDYFHFHFRKFTARISAEVPQGRIVQIAVETHGTKRCPKGQDIFSPWQNTSAGGPAYRPERQNRGVKLKTTPGRHAYTFTMAVERQDGGWRPPDRVLVCGAIYDQYQNQEQDGQIKPEAIAQTHVTVVN